MRDDEYVANGPKIRQLRRAKLLTQAELAACIGVAQPSVSALEHMHLGHPAWLPGLAEELGVPYPDVLIAVTSLAWGEPAKSPGPGEPFWTMAETGAFLGIGRPRVYGLMRAGYIEAARAGRSWRVVPASVRAYKNDPTLPLYTPRNPGPAVQLVDKARLRELRRERGWTQLQLSVRAGLGRYAVSALETGHHRATSFLPALAKALGVKVADLRLRRPVVDGENRWSVAGLAAALRVSKETIYRLIRSGELDCIRAGTSIRIPESAIRDYLRVSPGAELAFPGRAGKRAVISEYVVDGQLVRRLRRDHLMTQADLGAQLGVEQPVISKLEHGNLGQPEWLPDLAPILGVTVPRLLIPASAAPDSPPQEEAYWTASQTARYLDIDRRLVYALEEDGRITAARCGRSRRYDPASVRRFKKSPSFVDYGRSRSAEELPVDRHRLRELRTERGWTQLELAGIAGLTRSAVSVLETGHQASTTMLPALAKALGVPVGKLVEKRSTAPRKVYRVGDVAGMLGVSDQVIYRAIAAGKLGCERSGRKIRIFDSHLVAYLESRARR